MTALRDVPEVASRVDEEKGRYQSLMMSYAPVAAAALVLALVPLMVGGDRFFLRVATLGLAFVGYAIAFNVIFGATGQLFLCLGALAGLSGYTSGILSNDLNVPMLVSMLIGVLLASALGGLFSWISVRRRLDVIFVGIVTLAFSLVFTTTAQATRNLTGGETGMVVLAGSGTALRRSLSSYYIFLAVAIAFLAIYRAMQLSNLGWAFRAIRDDEVAAELAGINVARCKVIAGVVGSAMFGAIGALWVHHEGFLSPQTFAFTHIDVRIIVMLAFGGIGTLFGPIVGAATFTVIDEILRPFGQMRMAFYGVVLIVLFLGFRTGVVPAVTSLSRRIAGSFLDRRNRRDEPRTEPEAETR
jgi:branched-chain amino acid transport system permease protein